jgi:hypothetical protein
MQALGVGTERKASAHYLVPGRKGVEVEGRGAAAVGLPHFRRASQKANEIDGAGDKSPMNRVTTDLEPRFLP